MTTATADRLTPQERAVLDAYTDEVRAIRAPFLPVLDELEAAEAGARERVLAALRALPPEDRSK